MVGFPLLAVSLTHNPLLIADVAIAGRLPALLFSLPAGALADRVDRRWLAISANVVRGTALAVFTGAVLGGADSLLAIYATIFVLGTGDMAFDAATQACVPSMVAPESLASANGYLASAEVSGEQFVGPAVGGLIYSAAASAPFVGDAVSFVASAVLLRRALPDTPPRPGRPGLFSDVADGLRWFLGHRLLRLLALVVASLAFCQAMALSMLVLYGTRSLHLGRAGYGVFFAVAAIGNVAGALGASRVHARLGTAGCIVAAAVAAAGGYLVLSATRSVVVAAAALVLEGLAVAVGNVTTLSLRQRIIPAALMGRVGSAFRMLLYGLIPVGALVGGLISSAAGVRAAFVAAGAVQVVVVALAAPALVRRVQQFESV